MAEMAVEQVDLSVGSTVRLVSFSSNAARQWNGEVDGFLPLSVSVSIDAADALEVGSPITVITREASGSRQGHSTVRVAERTDTSLHLTLEPPKWLPTEQRQHRRVPVALSAAIRAVSEMDGTTMVSVTSGVTVDLSMAGVRVKLDSPVPVGCLVEFKTNLEVGSIRIFGAVVHADSGADRTGEIGIAFLDFVGTSRKNLESFLTSISAT